MSMSVETAQSVVAVLVALVVIRHAVFPALGWFWAVRPGQSQYSCLDETDPEKIPSKTKRPSERPVVKIIELTDLGGFKDRCQLTDVMYELTQVNDPELIVLYIHGWMHNRSSRHFQSFERLIQILDRLAKRMSPKRHAVGIYIAWQGAVGPLPVRPFTFWSRKRAADRITQTGVITKIVADIQNARRYKGRPDVTVMIGHSFGARMLFTATSHGFLRDVARAHSPGPTGTYSPLTGPADLVLLLNPAFEASVFSVVGNLRRRFREKFHPRQQPLLLAISTRSDWATRWLFPLGQLIGRARAPLQRATLGNYRRRQGRDGPRGYITHDLRPASAVDQAVGSPVWFDGFRAAGLALEMRARVVQPTNPFIVARTRGAVIRGHGGIWGRDLRAWLVRFLAEWHEQAK